MSTMPDLTTLHAILTVAQAGSGAPTTPSAAWLGLLPAVVGLIAGLTLWAAGGKLLKFGVILLGITLGGLLGLLLGSLAGASGAIVGVLIGTIAGGIAAGVFYRFAVGLTFGVGCGLAAAVVGLAVAGGGARSGATSANHRPIFPAAAAIISEEDDPEDQPNGIGGSEQPLTAPPAPLPPPAEVPDDLGPNPSDVEEPATEPARPPTTPKKPARPAAKAPAQPAAKDARPPAAQSKGSAERRNAANRQATAPKADPDFPGGPADGDAPPPPKRAARPDPTPPAPAATTATRRNTIFLDDPAQPTDVLSRLRGDLAAWWHNTGALGRSWAIGAGLIGLLAGTLVGMILPAKAASVLTAAAGSALWMICGLLLAHAASLPWPRADIVSPLAWVLIWVVITFIGVALQAGLGTGKVAKQTKKAKSEASKTKPKVAKG